MSFGQISRVLNVTSIFACGCTFAGVSTRPLLDFTFDTLWFRICVFVHRLRLVMFYFCGAALSSIGICVKHLADCALTGLKSDPKKWLRKAPK